MDTDKMYSIYHPPFTAEFKDAVISVEKEDNDLVYRRISRGVEERNILLLNNTGDIVINPIEPVNLPDKITSYMIVDFRRPVFVRPGDRKKIYLTFPVEIGVFMVDKEGNHEVIDIFTFSKIKFTLYGTHHRGLICRQWESDVFLKEQTTDLLHEGCIELEIINDSNHMMEVSKVMLNAYGMKIYYGENRLIMKASMRIINRMLAETDFTTYPTTSRFKRSMELYTARKLIINGTKGIMEFGL